MPNQFVTTAQFDAEVTLIGGQAYLKRPRGELYAIATGRGFDEMQVGDEAVALVRGRRREVRVILLQAADGSKWLCECARGFHVKLSGLCFR